jgi:squalene-hopene/tetraprenyl-beta-curcumene cyclase
MTGQNRTVASIGLLVACGVAVVSSKPATRLGADQFDAKAAASYLDARAEWWSTWPNAQRDRGTFCISCHTTLPYALARPELRAPLGERQPSSAESKILDNLLTRARNWREIEPFYPDQTRGIPKTSESRAIEAVMNALVLSRRDARAGHLSDDTRTALDVMWSLQMKTGPNNGAWTWLNFNYEPWESPNSPYFGASLAAVAVGSAPDGYAASPEVQDRVKALRGYFARASEQRKGTIDAAFGAQQVDGGWNTSSLGNYQRGDNTPNATGSDGYATALACLALQAVGVEDPRIARGLDWLRRNQDRATGRWTATSVNKARDPESDPGKFMDDAATAYAVLALTYGRK